MKALYKIFQLIFCLALIAGTVGNLIQGQYIFAAMALVGVAMNVYASFQIPRAEKKIDGIDLEPLDWEGFSLKDIDEAAVNSKNFTIAQNRMTDHIAPLQKKSFLLALSVLSYIFIAAYVIIAWHSQLLAVMAMMLAILEACNFYTNKNFLAKTKELRDHLYKAKSELKRL